MPFGSPLALSSIGATPQGCAGLRVLAVEPEAQSAAAHDAAQRLAALRPDAALVRRICLLLLLTGDCRRRQG